MHIPKIVQSKYIIESAHSTDELEARLNRCDAIINLDKYSENSKIFFTQDEYKLVVSPQNCSIVSIESLKQEVEKVGNVYIIRHENMNYYFLNVQLYEYERKNPDSTLLKRFLTLNNLKNAHMNGEPNIK